MPAVAIIAGAAISAYGAHKQASAAKAAAKTQAQSADQSLTFARDIYNDQKSLMSPYMQFGAESLANLGRMRDTPFGDQVNGLVANGQRGVGMTPSMPNAPQYAGQGGVPLSQIGQPPPPGGGLGPGTPAWGGGPKPPGFGFPGGNAQPPQGAMVQLRAPNGRVQAVPAQFAEQFIARGAQRVM